MGVTSMSMTPNGNGLNTDQEPDENWSSGIIRNHTTETTTLGELAQWTGARPSDAAPSGSLR